MKEIGIGLAMRIMAKCLRPRLIIRENSGKWILQSESSLTMKMLEFTPDIEFDEIAADGREVKVCPYIYWCDHPLSTLFFISFLLDDHSIQSRYMGTDDT